MISYETVKNCLKDLNIVLSDSVIQNLVKYWDFLISKNSKINLISRKTDYQSGFITHIIDSISILQISFPVSLNYLDLGTGAGLPGFALKLAYPLWNVHLVESKLKKYKFLLDLSSEFNVELLTIHNIFISDGNLSSPELNRSFDLVTSRAVNSLDELILKVGPLLKKGGYFVAYKGPNYKDELTKCSVSLKKYQMRLNEELLFSLPILKKERALIVFRKV
jgi:16S rRNA (guanine527-N7)-methyltransferase